MIVLYVLLVVLLWVWVSYRVVFLRKPMYDYIFLVPGLSKIIAWPMVIVSIIVEKFSK